MHWAGSLQSCVGKVGKGSIEVVNFSGGVTVRRAYWSPTPAKFNDTGALVLQPRGVSSPTVTFPGCVAYECTRSKTSNGFLGFVRTSITCLGSTARVKAGTALGAARSTRVEVACTLVTGELTVNE